MQVRNDTPTPAPLRISPAGTLVVEGWGTSLSVQAGQLVVRTGTGRTVRTGRFERAGRPKLRRLVIVGRTGATSLPALDWVRQVGASWAWIARDGEVLATSASLGMDDGRLRRAQALAALTEVGPRVIRHLLTEKIGGQLRVLRTRFPERRAEADAIDAALGALEAAPNAEQLRGAESQAAAAYWSGWKGLEMSFARRDLFRVPPRWMAFDSRASLITGNPRLATDPIGAMLNLAYSLVECESRVAMAAVGLDAGMAFGLHTDQRARANGALDLMEAARPCADEAVLDAIEGHVFRRADFAEMPNGVCRITPALARSLVEAWVPVLAVAVGPQAERVAAMLGAEAGIGRLPTHLTGSNRSAGRDPHRRQPARQVRRGTAEAKLPSACHSCGVVLDVPGRLHCDGCLVEVKAESGTTRAAKGRVRLAELRAEGTDPSRSPEARRKVGARNREHVSATLAWDAEYERPDPEAFTRDVLPAIQDVPLSRIAAATGLSIQHCGMIRRGLRLPHPRHWEALRGLVKA